MGARADARHVTTMPAIDRHHGAIDPSDWHYPLELMGAVDDREDPEQFTVFPRASVDVTTHWLSVDFGVVVDLDEMA